jgi:predicted  nucleic acid-binding Zn-ribbon protein
LAAAGRPPVARHQPNRPNENGERSVGMATRDEYVEKLKHQLDEWNEDIARFEATLAELTGPARERLEPYLAKAREGRDAAVRKLSELKTSGEGSWDKLRGDAEHLWKALRQSINYFKSQL